MHQSVPTQTDIVGRVRDGILPVYTALRSHGVNAVCGEFSNSAIGLETMRILRAHADETLVLIDMPKINVDDTEEARKHAEQTIRTAAQHGANICLMHHESCEQLVDKNAMDMKRLPNYLAMMRDCGMKPGISANMPEMIVYADEKGYDIAMYAGVFNCVGHLMQVELEQVIQIMHAARKPILVMDPTASGRVTPYVGLTFNWNVLPRQDLMAIDSLTPEEGLENLEISMAALQRRLPTCIGRATPSKNQTLFKKL